MHPAVADACVVSVLDEYSGELPLAYVVIDPTAVNQIKDENEMKAALIKVCLPNYNRISFLTG